jgi:hypothetical protein
VDDGYVHRGDLQRFKGREAGGANQLMGNGVNSQSPNSKPQILIALVLTTLASASLQAQERGAAPAAGRAGGPPPSARAAAPFDPTGYWVAIISEDWRWRMVTPAKGDVVSIPLNPEGLRVAEAWDPAKDEASGEQCKAYGAPGLMRGPTRLHITWQDDNTLKVESDYGTQTRLLRFGTAAAGGAGRASGAGGAGRGTWQGVTTAQWNMAAGGGRGRGGARHGSIKAVTTQLRPGYLRKNGVPYSDRAVFTEYIDLQAEANGDQYLVDTNLVEDSVYLQTPWITALHFKKEPDGSKWDPTPCDARF